MFQGLLWLFIISLVPRNLKSSEITNKYKNISILLLSYLFSYSIYGESRFYENNLYEFNFSNIKSYFLLFLTVYLISKNLIDIYEERSENLINFIPFIYLFTFIFSGFNLSFWQYYLYILELHHFLMEKEMQNLITYMELYQFGG